MKKLITVLGIFIMLTGTAYCQVVKDNTWYSIISCQENKALQMQGATGKENGLQIRIGDSTGTANQLFRFKKEKGGYFTIVSKTGKVLEIKDASQELHGVVQQAEPNGADNQLFALVKHTDNIFAIVAKHSGFGFDVFQDGTLIQYQMYGSKNQTFRIVVHQ